MYYITTPIPYVNGEPHLGHLLEAIFNDTIARYRRRTDFGVLFSMGLDQHGLKIHQKAQELNLKTQEYVNRESRKFKQLWQVFEITCDAFVETSGKKHKVISTLVWRKLAEKNLIYKKKYTGLYCVGCEAFYSQSQLDEHGNCLIHKTKPMEMTEENYFFKLSEFSSVIAEFITQSNILPQRSKKEWLNFLAQGLDDISISRERKNLPWGISVPNDENQVMYVWFEALVNYLTAVADDESVDKVIEFPEQSEEFIEEIWSTIEEKLPINLIYMGKDVAKFHLVVWIGMLSALGLPFTQTSIVHGFINDAEGRKFSKSLGNGVSPQELVDRYGVDGTRFALIHEVNFLEDTNFDWHRIDNSYNANLADNLGNLVVRVSNLVEKFLNGLVDFDGPAEPEILTKNLDLPILEVNLNNVYKPLEAFNPHLALQNLFSESAKINQYLEQTKPWTLAKDVKNQEKIKFILTLSAKSLLEIGKALSIFLPQSGEKIVKVFSSERITKAEILFAKIEKL